MQFLLALKQLIFGVCNSSFNQPVEQTACRSRFSVKVRASSKLIWATAHLHVRHSLMVVCSKCSKADGGLKGEIVALLIWGAAVILIPLFGMGMVVLMPFGLYFYLFYHSRGYVCRDCRATTCPDCSGKITQNNYCKSCKKAHCPYCGHRQTISRDVSWTSAFFWVLLSPLILALIFISSAINVLLFPVAYLFYEGITSPRCSECNKRILLSSF